VRFSRGFHFAGGGDDIAIGFVKRDVARDVCPRFLRVLSANDGLDNPTVRLLHKESLHRYDGGLLKEGRRLILAPSRPTKR
jgi:hypothetical protein